MNNYVRIVCAIMVGFIGITFASYGNEKSVMDYDTLKVGDKMPDMDLGMLENGQKIGNFSDQRQRLIIFDFMNSSCTSCIAALPRLSTLQEKFKKSLKIYPVTYEERSRIEKMRKMNRLFSDAKLDFIVHDQQLKKLFPHQTVSHVVWILDGEIKGITHVEYLDEKMIETILKEGQLNVPQKNDFVNFDYAKPLLKQNYPLASYSLLTGFISDADTKFGTNVDRDSLSVREYMINVPVISAYMYAYGKVFKLPYMKGERIIIESNHADKYRFHPNRDSYEESWKMENAISYEAVFKKSVAGKDRMNRIIKDLDNKLNLFSSIEKRLVDCWIVINGKGKGSIVHENGQPIKDFVFMADLDPNIPPIVNESTIHLKVQVKAWSSFDDLRMLLIASGYDLKKEKREIDVFVLRD